MVPNVQALKGEQPMEIKAFAWPEGKKDEDEDLLGHVAAYLQVSTMSLGFSSPREGDVLDMLGDMLASLS